MSRLPRLVVSIALTGCTGVAAPGQDTDVAGACSVPDDHWDPPTTTLSDRLVLDAALPQPAELDPAFTDGLEVAEAAGLGTWHHEAGEPWTLRDSLAPGHGGGGTGRRSLAMIFHQCDAQIADAESPIRMVAAEDDGATESAARPQELYALHALDALVHTIDDLAETTPMDFALFTGDNADNDQENELGWFRDVLDGVRVRPDSGAADSQCDDEGHDPLAEFQPTGLHMPWYAVAGNHDVLVQGNFANTTFAEQATGTDAPYGTRDLSQPGGPLVFASVADPMRRVMARTDIAGVLLDSPAMPGPVGHGFSSDNVRDDTVNWVVDPIAGVPLTVISVDANPPAPGDGVLTDTERDTFLVPALQAAQDAGKLIIVTSHYPLGTTPMEDGGTVGDLLETFPNVVAVIAGHWHTNHVEPFGEPDDPGAFWEIVSASVADWPPQGRLVELVDNGDGTLSIVCTVIDVPAPEGSMAERFRHLAAIDLQTGWRIGDGSASITDRNVELVQRLPVGWTGGFGTEGVRSLTLP